MDQFSRYVKRFVVNYSNLSKSPESIQEMFQLILNARNSVKFPAIIVDERKENHDEGSCYTPIFEEYFLKYSNCFLSMQQRQSTGEIFLAKTLK